MIQRKTIDLLLKSNGNGKMTRIGQKKLKIWNKKFIYNLSKNDKKEFKQYIF
jgi:hypothetical protein